MARDLQAATYTPLRRQDDGTSSNEAYSMEADDDQKSEDIAEDTEEETQEETSVEATTSGTDETMSTEELQACKDDLVELQEQIESKQARLQKVIEYWQDREEQLKQNIKERSKEVEALEQQLHAASYEVEYGLPPSGPESLAFVTGKRYSLLVCIVIIVNLFFLTVSVMSPDLTTRILFIDDVFVVFYIVDLVMRWAYYQRSFLRGPAQIVVWHWLDLLLVINGVYIAMQPKISHNSVEAETDMTHIRLLRLFRYARLVRLLREIFKTNLAWVEGDAFQKLIMILITGNAVVMGLEVEYPSLNFLWESVQEFVLLLFTFEMAVRIRHVGGWKFFHDRDNCLWNNFDFVIVASGAVDQWILPLVDDLMAYLGDGYAGSEHSVRMDTTLQLARVLRLLRILRLVRLIKSIKPLYTLIVGVFTAMQGMSWVMALTVTTLYIAALIGVKLVGPHGLLTAGTDGHLDSHDVEFTGFNTTSKEVEAVMECFPDMFGAVFNMFKVMQMDLGPVEPLFEWAPVTKYIIIVYVVITNWAIFSILTAVVSDEMAKATESLEDERNAVELRKRNNDLVAQIFDRLDPHRHGTITWTQFRNLLQSEEEVQELCEGAGLDPTDLREFFHIVADHSGSELCITRQAFLEGLEKEQAVVNERSMLKLEKRLDELDNRFLANMAMLDQKIDQKVAEALAVVRPQTPSASPMSRPRPSAMSSPLGSPVAGRPWPSAMSSPLGSPDAGRPRPSGMSGPVGRPDRAMIRRLSTAPALESG